MSGGVALALSVGANTAAGAINAVLASHTGRAVARLIWKGPGTRLGCAGESSCPLKEDA
jgi:hypothetical protein